MMRIFFILIALSFSKMIVADDEITCYIPDGASQTCIQTTESDFTVYDPFSENYWENLVSISGSRLIEGIVDGSQSAGEEFAKAALSQVAVNMGIPPQLLALAGLSVGSSSDISNSQLSALIENLIREQTEILIDAIETGNEQVVANIQETIFDVCIAEYDINYDLTIEGLSSWNLYSLDDKGITIDVVHDAIHDLGQISRAYQVRFSDGDNCYSKKHVEFFPWIMHVLSLRQGAQISHINFIASDNGVSATEDLVRGIKDVLDITKKHAEDIIGYLENTNITSEILDYDEEVVGDKANIWWDDVVYSFGDINENNSQCNIINLLENSYLDEVISMLDTGFEVYESVMVVHCPSVYTYYMDGVEYSISKYKRIGRIADIGDVMDGLDSHDNALDVTTVLSHDQFYGNIDENYNSYDGSLKKLTYPVNYRSYYANENKVEFYEKAVSLVNLHMNFEYKKRLHNNYLAYQGLLNSIWDNVGVSRPSNKMDREVERLLGVETNNFNAYFLAENNGYIKTYDSDGDGMPDMWEVLNGLDMLDNDAAENPDGDSFTNIHEYNNGTDPQLFNAPLEIESFNWYGLPNSELGYGAEARIEYSSTTDHCKLELPNEHRDMPGSATYTDSREIWSVLYDIDPTWLEVKLICFNENETEQISIIKSFSRWDAEDLY